MRNEGKVLSDITSKHYEELTYYDVKALYYQLNVPLSIDLRNFEYIIKEETDDYIIGHQFNKRTKEKIMDIISFNSMMVLDYDIKKDNDDDNDHDTKKQILLKYIIDKLSEYPYTFYIYETFNGYHVYCTSKFAVDAISKSMRIDLLKHNIKVTAIHPGAVETEFSIVRYKGDETKANATYNGFTPLTGDDIADAIFYAAQLPAHVCINELTITCTQQGSATNFYKNNK